MLARALFAQMMLVDFHKGQLEFFKNLFGWLVVLARSSIYK